MKAQRFTDSFLMALRPAAKNYKVRDKSDAIGFGVQVARGGTRTFFVALSVDGKQRYIGLQRYRPPVTENGKRVLSNLSQQRAQARKLRDLRNEGINPVRWLAEQAEERRVGSFGELLDAYIESLGSRPSAALARQTFDKNIRPFIDLETPAREVSSDLLTTLLARMHGRGAHVAAERARTMLSAAFNYGATYDRDPKYPDRPVRFRLTRAINPVANIASHQRDERPRERNLSPEELRAFWSALAGADGINPATADLLKLALLTGQRLEQFRKARRRELLLDENLWVFPPASMKTRNPATARPHAIPITPMAREIIESRCAMLGVTQYESALNLDGIETPETASIGDALLFPHDRDPMRLMDKGTPGSAVRRLCERHGLPLFQARDIRRTFKTQTGELGIRKADRDLVQAHGVARDTSSKHYDRHEYIDDKRRVLTAWDDYLRGILTDTNVTAIRRA